MANRDEQSDTSRTGQGRASRDSHMRDIPTGGGTAAEWKSEAKRRGIPTLAETRGASDIRPAGDG